MTFSRNIKIFLLITVIIGAASVVYADDSVKLIVPIGGITRTGSGAGAVGPDEYVKTFYQWSIGLAALLAMAQLVLGGLQYVLAAGNISSKEAANERIRSSLVGLLILISIVTVLTTINPNLANLTPASVQPNAIGALDYAALNANTQADIRKLTSVNAKASSTKDYASVTARRDAGDPKFFEANRAMISEINQFTARIDDDLQEVIGDADQDLDDADMPLDKLRDLVSQRRIKIADDSAGYDDFYQYAELAVEAYAAGNKTDGDGYSEAVRNAVSYAFTAMKPEDRERTALLISVVEPKEVKDIMLGTRK
jgi:hypothetical protein